MPGRLKWLVGMHLLLGVTPVLMFAHPGNLQWVPVTWALASVTIGQLMLLAVWAGLGNSTGEYRWIGSISGLAYLAIWPALAPMLSSYADESVASVFARHAGIDGMVFAVMLGIVLLMRRRFTIVRFSGDVEPQVGRQQFSVRHLLAVIACVAAFLASARVSVAADVTSFWFSIVGSVMFIVAFGASLIVAVWAALAPGLARWRVAAVFLLAIVLGFALSYTMLFRSTQEEWRLWLTATQTAAFALPTVIVVLSLLVVRWAGYRLAPKRIAEKWRNAQQHRAPEPLV